MLPEGCTQRAAPAVGRVSQVADAHKTGGRSQKLVRDLSIRRPCPIVSHYMPGRASSKCAMKYWCGRYLRAPNAEVVHKRKTGKTVPVNLRALSADLDRKSVVDERTLTCEEPVKRRQCPDVLKQFMTARRARSQVRIPWLQPAPLRSRYCACLRAEA